MLNGKTVIPAGTDVQGRVIASRPSGRLRGVAQLRLALDTIELNGSSYDLKTSTIARQGANHKKRNWWMIGGGTGFGALIGGLVGGGKGALIGSAAGAGAGTAAAAYTGKKDVHLPTETPLHFKLREPLTVEVRS